MNDAITPTGEGYVLSRNAVDQIKSLINDQISHRINTVSRAGDQTFEHNESMAPEVYVAQAPVNGIPALIKACGTAAGSGSCFEDPFDSPDMPGYGDCIIYRVMPDSEANNTSGPGLIQVNIFPKRVYNISSEDIPGRSWLVAVREKSGNYIAIGFSTNSNSSGTTDVKVACHLFLDGEHQINVDTASLVDPTSGLLVDFSSGECGVIKIKLGCALIFDSDGAIKLDRTQVIGAGLTVGTGSCDIAVKTGCHLIIDSTNAVDLDVTTLLGKGLKLHPGSCNSIDVDVIGIGTAIYNIIIQPGVTINNGLTVVNNYLAVATGCGLFIDGAGNVALDLTGVVGNGLEWDQAHCQLTVDVGCGLFLGVGIEVDFFALAGIRAASALLVRADAACDSLGVDLIPDPLQTTTEISDRITGIHVVNGVLQISVIRTTYTNYFDLAGLHINRTASLPLSTFYEASICNLDCGTGSHGTGSAGQAWYCLTYTGYVNPICEFLTVVEFDNVINSGNAVYQSGPHQVWNDCMMSCGTGTNTAAYYCLMSPDYSKTECFYLTLVELAEAQALGYTVQNGPFTTELSCNLLCIGTGTGTGTNTTQYWYCVLPPAIS
jgi:hypothetical protein